MHNVSIYVITVIYNNDLTVAFLKSVQKVLGNHFTPKRVRIFVSLEKR